MPKSRPPYPPEFRQQIIELAQAGRTPEELAKEFEPSARAQADAVWVADMTYVPTWAGFLYLAVVLDVFSRRVNWLGHGGALENGAGLGCIEHGLVSAAARGGNPPFGSRHAVYVHRLWTPVPGGRHSALSRLGGRLL